MNRLAGIIVAVVGLLIAILSILKVIPDLGSTGISLILLGGLVIGLSFVKKPDPEDTERMSTVETLLKVFYAPVEVFQNLRRHPRWLVAVLIATLLSAVYTSLFLYRLTPERVTDYIIDKTLEMPMIANNEEARKQVEAGRATSLENNKNPVIRAGQAVNSFTSQTFKYAFFGAVFFLFALAMGGKMNFWQAFSAAVYANFPWAVIHFALNTLILFLKDPSDIHPILGQGSLVQDNLGFLVTPSESPVVYTLLSSFGLLNFYWIWLNATGLKNAGERVSSAFAWTATITVFVLMVLMGIGVALLFPSFIG
jgi:Yip1 domain.